MKNHYLKAMFISVLMGSAYLCADTIEEKITQYWSDFKQDIPGSSLVSNEWKDEGLALKDFQFDTSKQYTVVSPGEEVVLKMRYEINADDIESFDFQHYVYGLDSVGPIGCLAHNFGLITRRGKMEIEFKAPKEKGIYELRVTRVSQGFLLDKTKVDWDSVSNSSTVAIIAVD